MDTKDREIACVASRSMQRFPSQQAWATRTSHLHFRCSEISWTIDCRYGERPSHAPISLTPFWASLSAHWNSFWSTSISTFETVTTYKLIVFTPNCLCIIKRQLLSASSNLRDSDLSFQPVCTLWQAAILQWGWFSCTLRIVVPQHRTDSPVRKMSKSKQRRGGAWWIYFAGA